MPQSEKMSLSDKIQEEKVREDWVKAKDVKECFKRLKQRMCLQPMMDCGSKECGLCDNCRKIDEEAGGSLT